MVKEVIGMSCCEADTVQHSCAKKIECTSPKDRRPREESSLISKALRRFDTNRGFDGSLSNPEEIIHAHILGTNSQNYHNTQKEIQTAFLEAELKKTEARAWHQRNAVR